MRKFIFSTLLATSFFVTASAQFSVETFQGENVIVVKLPHDSLYQMPNLTLGVYSIYSRFDGNGFVDSNPRLINGVLVFRFNDRFQKQHEYCLNAVRHELYVTSDSDDYSPENHVVLIEPEKSLGKDIACATK